MPGGNGFFGPEQYSILWTVLAVLILAAVVIFYVVVTRLTRPRDLAPQAPDLSWISGLDRDALRQSYLDRIGAIETAHRERRATAREAHQQLSLLIRVFAFESSGIRAPQMTLTDLRQTRATALGDAVEQLYPGAFDGFARDSVDDAARLAREVVRSWT